jgi:YbbR domain-containing protein
MKKQKQKAREIISSLFFAFFLAVIIWAIAINAEDPTEQHSYGRAVSVAVEGLDEALTVVSMEPATINVELSAPNSIWANINRDSSLITAKVDLSNYDIGYHSITPEVNIGISPVRLTSIVPAVIVVRLDAYLERELDIQLEIMGSPAIGFEADKPVVNTDSVTVSGPSTEVELVDSVQAALDIEALSQSFVATLPLKAYDADGREVSNVTLSPKEVVVTQPITQMGGFRNLVVKVVVQGQIAEGYRMTNVSSYPGVVTVFSSDPGLVDGLPGYVETEIVDITGANDDLDLFLKLNLPSGISVVGENLVQVQVGIAAIESSLTLANMPVELIGLEEGYEFSISPTTVDVLLSGPLPVLDKMKQNDVRVFIDMTGATEGVYQRVPQIEVYVDSVVVESTLPESVEVVVVEIKEETFISNSNILEWQTATPDFMSTPTVTPTVPSPSEEGPTP